MNTTCPQCGRVVEYTEVCPDVCPHCGGVVVAKTDYRETETLAGPAGEPPRERGAAADVVGGNRLVRKLGQGGMGAVWEAEHVESGRRVALKLLSPNLAPSEETIERFLREARLAASLSHPRSTFVFGAGGDQGQPFITMELMPGRTLQDMVNDEGPLPPARAVDYILDVIDGLEAAHALGVIHRDVKPSNCFLDGDGRVKVGDFGLSKSLASDAQLTRTGAFMGTPMFAAPEQVRGGEVDKRTDVYGVGATLYYLLAKRGPFTGDAVAMIAQIASDPPPPLRRFCPPAPQALEQIIGRTLDKDPARRYQELSHLRQALAPFATGGTSIADVWRRLAAYMLDILIISLIGSVLMMSVQVALAAGASSRGGDASAVVGRQMMHLHQAIGQIAMLLLQAAYFAIAESRWGCGLGKLLMGLRVVGPEAERPPLWRTALRALFIPGALGLGLLGPLYLLTFSSGASIDEAQGFTRQTLTASLLGSGASLVFVLLCLTTMRARNGYRGVHEFASGTRTVRLNLSVAGAAWKDVPIVAATSASGEAERFGPFRAVGQLGVIDAAKVLLARDEVLHRSVWVLHAGDGASISAMHRTLARPTRPRWLQGAEAEGVRWDAFEAIHGAPLPAWLGPDDRLEWRRARGLLRDLAAELTAAVADNTLPLRLSLEQLWIDRSGRLKLLAAPLVPADGRHGSTAAAPEDGGVAAAVRLLRAAANQCCRRESLPVHARLFLDDLHQRPEQAETLGWAVRELNAMMDRPASLDWAYRMATMAVGMGTEFPLYVVACLGVPLALWSVQQVDPVLWAALSTLLVMLLPALLGFAFRGGPVLRFMKVEVRRRDGSRAGRPRCAWRSFVAYAGCLYFYSLLGVLQAKIVAGMWSGKDPSDLFRFNEVEDTLTPLLFLGSLCSSELLLLVFLAGVVYALVRPERGWQDILAGTRLVPK